MQNNAFKAFFLTAVLAIAFLAAGCLQSQFSEGSNAAARGPAVWNGAKSTPQQQEPAASATGGPSGTPEAQENLTGGVYDVAENMLVSLNSSNYTGFVRGFSARFKALMTEKAFKKSRIQILNASGFYVSKGRAAFYEAGGFAFYSLPTRFTNDFVNTTIIFNSSSGEIEGVAFDSPLLRLIAASNKNSENSKNSGNSTPG